MRYFCDRADERTTRTDALALLSWLAERAKYTNRFFIEYRFLSVKAFDRVPAAHQPSVSGVDSAFIYTL